jgi:CHASE2 domain-containing sensor protein
MKTALQILIAIVIIVVAWKILKGLLGLAIGIAIAGLIIYGGVKLLEGPKR